MSAPNKNYDPVEVTALTAEEVERATTAALTAISSVKTLDELKEARIAHAGDKAPLSLARADLGAGQGQRRLVPGVRDPGFLQLVQGLRAGYGAERGRRGPLDLVSRQGSHLNRVIVLIGCGHLSLPWVISSWKVRGGTGLLAYPERMGPTVIQQS